MNTNTPVRQLYQTSQRALRYPHAPFRIRPSQLVAQRNLHYRPAISSVVPKWISNRSITGQLRHESTEATAKPLTDRQGASELEGASQRDEIAARKAQEPAYELTFTCRKCMERSSHRVTKQAYHFGTTLITCPGCKNRHLISDHMKIFSDKSVTLEDILKEKGQFLRKGRLGEDGDIEFYDEMNNEIGQTQDQAKE